MSLRNITCKVQKIVNDRTKHVTLENLEQNVDDHKLLSMKNLQYERLINETIEFAGVSEETEYYSSKFMELRRKLISRKAGKKCQNKKNSTKEQIIADIEILKSTKCLLLDEKLKLEYEIEYYSISIYSNRNDISFC